MAGFIYDYEIATTLGALDDAAFADGKPLSSYVTRTLATTANGLRARADNVLCINWDANIYRTGYQRGDCLLPAGPVWTRIGNGPYPIAKKPGTDKLRVYVHSLATGDALIQVTTTTRPFRSKVTVSDDNAFLMEGTGITNRVTDSLTNIPCDPGTFELVDFWIRAGVTATTGNATTFSDGSGAPYINTGTVGVNGNRGSIIEASDTDATKWIRAGSGTTWAHGGHTVLIHETGDTSKVLMEPRKIVYVGNGLGDDNTTQTGELGFMPRLPDARDMEAFVGKPYLIHKMIDYRCGSISVMTEELT